MKTRNRFPIAVVIALLMPFLQACSKPGSSSESSAETPAAVQDLTASYLPLDVKGGDVVTITPAGGTPPYTYELIFGAGALTGNVYVAPNSSEEAVIEITDSAGEVVNVEIEVDGVAATPTPVPTATPTPNPNATPTPTPNPNATPTPTPAPTATPTPAPSGPGSTTLPNGTVVARSCSLGSVTYPVNLATWLNYEYCLVLGRFAGNTEGYNWYHAVKDGHVSMDLLSIALFNSGELNMKYGTLSMSNDDYVTFMFRHLLYRDPTASERTSYTALAVRNGQAGVYRALRASFEFYDRHPTLYQARFLEF